GLCVRSCREVMDIHALGLMGRGFTTEPSPAFALPLDQTKCNNCGLCVQLCPTGALTERSVLSKQVPLDEQYTEEFIDIDGQKASVLVSRYNGKILRVIPNDGISRSANLSREQLLAKLQ
ncbi:MAG: 4Fe-4S binding protein, partial [Ruminococcus sp.]|uniref:4Fe-4S binding protein n=1 Tax=Ruminococcus sp. TaxID=41978 RepID=UPI002873D8BB